MIIVLTVLDQGNSGELVYLHCNMIWAFNQHGNGSVVAIDERLAGIWTDKKDNLIRVKESPADIMNQIAAQK